MHGSTEEIKMRCSSILNEKELVALVEKSSSPLVAYEMVFVETTQGHFQSKSWQMICGTSPEVFCGVLQVDSKLHQPRHKQHSISRKGGTL